MNVAGATPLVNATTDTIELALGATAAAADGPLRDATRRLCLEARRLDLQPEAIVILLKKAWRSNPHVHELSPGTAMPLLDAVITGCIDEYYRSPSGR